MKKISELKDNAIEFVRAKGATYSDEQIHLMALFAMEEYANQKPQEVKQEDKLDDMKPHIEHLRKRIDEIRPQIAGLGSMESAIRSLEDIYSQSELNKTSPLPKQVLNVTDEQIKLTLRDFAHRYDACENKKDFEILYNKSISELRSLSPTNKEETKKGGIK